MRYLFSVIALLLTITHANALIINEVYSNPVGDDSGREWIELYNETDQPIAIGTLSISIKGGAFLTVSHVAGGTTIPSKGYAIVGSVVSGATKFLLDYPNYNGPLFKASISLVNTGITSIELKHNGVTVDTLASYTAAKEGASYSRLDGSFVTGEPTPGEDNKAQAVEQDTVSEQTQTQSTLPQATPPSADITLYLEKEKSVVAGADALFSVFGLTQGGKQITNLSYQWSFGDGGSSNGSSTYYRYLYPGRYSATVEATNGTIIGKGKMMVTVYSPELTIASFGSSKYGSYIDIANMNPYDVDISQWKMYIGVFPYTFPKNMILSKNQVTRISGVALGFASTSVQENDVIKLVFPSGDEVVRMVYHKESTKEKEEARPIAVKRDIKTTTIKQGVAIHQKAQEVAKPVSPVVQKEQGGDRRVVRWIGSLFQ